MPPAVLRAGLHRSAAGARGGGTPRCHAAVFGGEMGPVLGLRCAVLALPSLPGAARHAAAGPGGPRDRAARGDGGSNPGGARLLHEGALRLAGAVPRRMRDGHRLRGWDTKEVAKFSFFLHRSHWSHLNSNYTRAILLHIFFGTHLSLIVVIFIWTLTLHFCTFVASSCLTLVLRDIFPEHVFKHEKTKIH